MRFLKIFGVVALATAAGVLVTAYAPFGPHLLAQGKADGGGGMRQLSLLTGRGSEIGVSVRDIEPEQAEKQRISGGAFVDDVRLDSAAEKAGLKRADVIVEFDGEHVRSARQFSRLVQEAAPGRTVRATVLRDGKRVDLQVTPTEGRSAMMTIEGDRLAERMREGIGNMNGFFDYMPPLNFNFDLPGFSSRGRLGVSVDELTDQLAAYFGAKEGVLVAAVTDDSPAAHAGIRAGDVITSVNGNPVRSREDLVREVSSAGEDEVTIGIVRDKKEIVAKAKIEALRRPTRSARPA
jgi:serine protease Do